MTVFSDDLRASIILQGIGGSRAYGTNRPDSDIDRLGIYLAPIRSVLGFTDHAKSYHFVEPSDFHLHELERFLALALKGNPTIMELLWLESYEEITDIGEFIVYNRSKLMGADLLRRSYIGYAKQQLKRNGHEPPQEAPEERRKRLKHLGHCYRLLLQAKGLIATGELTVRLTASQISDIERFKGLSFKMMQIEFEDIAENMSLTESTIPEQPDRAWAEDFLIKVRKRQVKA